MGNLHFNGQTSFYRGKVRDVYGIGDRLLVMVASNRISAFDVILPHPIPFKGQVLNQVAARMLMACTDICPNWLLDTPAPHVSIGKKCTPFKIELVVRGNLTGHAWRTYASGKRELCGISLPEGMRENDYFPSPIITPTTKAEQGHDEDISAEEIIARGLLNRNQWEEVSGYALALFERGKKLAGERGLILVDTKYEFGTSDGSITLMDEIHTPDSSRYFEAEGFEDRLIKGEKQRQLSKEFVREWLIAHNFMGKEGQEIPEMSKEWIAEISGRYIELYERLTGLQFQREEISDEETTARVNRALEKIT
ncbi:MAG TPA: phosphoribosylaminoimidazolesuccinocarboxamide synthase [Chitinophagaceae bacterium]|nr:phosphoribosylaminoimidazolesuccinocarboxamide synthase [Chitinophagaceae bacterium]